MLLYGLHKLRFTERFRSYSAVMLILYFAAYVLLVDKSKWSVEAAGLASPAQCFKLIYYFYIYTLGYTIGQTPDRAARGLPVPAVTAFLLSFVCKALYVWRPALLKFQFVSQFLGIWRRHLPGKMLTGRVPASVSAVWFLLWPRHPLKFIWYSLPLYASASGFLFR